MILVTGASGMVGTSICRQLIMKGQPVRAMVHRKSAVEVMQRLGVENVVVGNICDPYDLDTALSGADALFHICPTAAPNEDLIGINVLDAAKKKGNVFIVYHSVLHSILPDLPHHRRKLAVEQRLITSGLDYTILQPAVFLQTLMPAVKSVRNSGPLLQKFYLNNESKMSFVDLEDYAEVVGKVFQRRAYISATLELCGESNLTLQDMLTIFKQVFHHEVTEEFISDEDFLRVQGQSFDNDAAKTILTMFEHYTRYGFPGNTAILTDILQRNPYGLREFLTRMRETK